MAFHPDALTNALAEYEFAQPQPHYAVALSGGADSLALLVALSRTVSAKRILALHFNHRIHPDACTWVDHCKMACDKLGIEFRAGEWRSGDSAGNGESRRSESAAREARYQWFASVLPRGSILLTGHHLDDQAETVLMNLAEGRSLERVAGIRKSRAIEFGDDRLVARPLLGFTHAELCQFLSDNAIGWIEDPANSDCTHSRNLIRQDILPRLTARWPQATRSLSRFADALSDSLVLVDAYAESLLQQLRQPQRRTLFCRGIPLLMTKQSMPSEQAFNVVIRRWCHQADAVSPGHRQLLEFRGQLISASSEQHCSLGIGDDEIILYDGHLYLIRRRHISDDFHAPCSATMNRFGNFLEVSFDKTYNGLDHALVEEGELRWCKRQPGHLFSTSIGAGTTTLKKAMQSARLAPWLRQGLPVLAEGESVVWAHGLGISAQFIQKTVDKGCLVPKFVIADSQVNSGLHEPESG